MQQTAGMTLDSQSQSPRQTEANSVKDYINKLKVSKNLLLFRPESNLCVFFSDFRVNWAMRMVNLRSTRSRVSFIEVKLNRWDTFSSQLTKTTCRTSCPNCSWSATLTMEPLLIKSKRTFICSRDWLTWRKIKARCSNRLTITLAELSTWSKTLATKEAYETNQTSLHACNTEVILLS